MSESLKITIEKLNEKESKFNSGTVPARELPVLAKSIAKFKRRIERLQKEAAKPAPKEG